jgi:hypothetical protein
VLHASETTNTSVSTISVGPTQELSLVAFEGDICIAHLFRNFVYKTYGTLWLEQAAGGKLGDLSSEATKALSQYTFGVQNKVQDIELQGAVRYGKCLRVLASELENGPKLHATGHGLVVPILVLLIYAVCYPPVFDQAAGRIDLEQSLQADRPAALSHLRGIAKMLDVCGPEAFQRQPLTNAFDAARSTLVLFFPTS